jgi:5-methylcytosine-specific restriction endonuclease McrA
VFHYKRTPEGDIDGEFLQHLWDMQGGRCSYCGDEMRSNTISLEHMKPIYRGGGNWKENVVFACWDCNSRKGIKTVEQFGEGEMKPLWRK